MRGKIQMACGGVLALGALAAPAQAADTIASDMHCMVIGTIMADAQNEELKSAGLYMTIYYLGRLDGSGKDVDFKAGYQSEIGKLKEESMETEAKSCGDLLTARGATLSEMGQTLTPPPDADKPAAPATPAPAAPEKPAP